MNPQASSFFNNSHLLLRTCIAFISLFLSVFLITINDVINSDGVLYIHTAQAFLDSGIKSILKHFDWPFYSIIIAMVSKISQLNLEHSAYLFNTLCFIIFNDAIYRIFILINKHQEYKQHLWIILLVIFLPTINSYRTYIIRDIPYLACLFYAFYYLLCYLKSSKTFHIYTWQVLIILAFLFRPEAAAFALAGIYSIYLTKNKKQNIFKHTMQHFIIFVIAGLLLILFLFQQNLLLQSLTRPIQITTLLSSQGITLNFNNLVTSIGSTIPKYSAEDAAVIAFTGLFCTIVYMWINALNIIFVASGIYARNKITLATTSTKKMIHLLIAISFFIIFLFMFAQTFMSTRYMLTLITLSAILLALYIYQYINTHNTKFIKTLAILLIFLFAADSLIETNSKTYIKKIVQQTIENKQPKAHIYATDVIVAYYINSNYPTTKTLTFINDNAQTNDLIIIKQEEIAQLNNLKLSLSPTTQNLKKQKFAVYKVNKIIY